MSREEEHEESETQEGNLLDKFLGHQASTRGKRSMLGGWKEEGSIVLWLHRKAGIVPIWNHNWPRLVTRKDKDTDEERVDVFSQRWVCHEKEAILLRQRFRDDDGNREMPPAVCPLCVLTEWLRKQVVEKKMSWVEPVFRFEGDDPDRMVTITAGGAYNAFSKKDITNQEKAELRKAGIRRDEAFRENLIARCQYIFCVVAHGREDEGVQLTVESSTLGDKMKGAIRDQIRSLGKTDGNPLLHPYPFEWQYDAEQEFAKKYHVVALPKETPSEETLRLITETDPPDLAEMIEHGDIAALRAEMEEHALISIPFDEIFGPAEKLYGPLVAKEKTNGKPAPEVHTSQQTIPQTKVAEAAKAVAEVHKQATREPSKAAAKAEAELFECDHCREPTMTDSDFECPKCGCEYDEDKATGRILPSKRPCCIEGCKGKAPVDAKSDNTICEKCGTIIAQKTWTAVQTPEPTRSRSASSRVARR